MRKMTLGLAVVVALLAGCGSTPDTPEETPTTTAATTAEVDRTSDLQAAIDNPEVVTKAVETEHGRLTIETSIVDDREDGGDDATQAITICEAGKALLDAPEPYVAVMEDDGTSFVIAGHPAYGAECTEIP